MQVIGWGRMVWSIGAVAWLGCIPVEAERPIAAEASPTGDIPQSAWPEAWFRPPAHGFGSGIADLPPVARTR